MDLLAASGGVLRAGLALKLNQVKRATQSWLRDGTDQATGTAKTRSRAARENLNIQTGLVVVT